METNVDRPPLPRLMMRQAIAGEIHAGVDRHFLAPDKACYIYAHVSALVASVLTRREYSVMAGTFTIECNQEPVGGTHLRYEWTQQPLEFHAWAATANGEVIDLSSRHHPAQATRLGIPWTRPKPPAFMWGYAEDLGRDHHCLFNATAEATIYIRESFHRDPQRDQIVHLARDIVKSLH